MAKRGSFSSFSTSVEVLKAAQSARQQEARKLFEAGYYAGAVLMGYLAVEIALKVYICRVIGHTSLLEAYHTHDLKGLLNAIGLFEAATKERKQNPRSRRGSVTIGEGLIATHRENWKVILKFTETDIINLRYSHPLTITEANAKAYLDAIDLAPNGVILWLDQQE